MRPDRGLPGTIRVWDVSQEWAVVRHETEADGK
jgi:hypothetical protein